MDYQRYASRGSSKKLCAWLASLSLSVALVCGLLHEIPSGDTGSNTLTRYTSQSERLTEYLFEGVESKPVWA